MKDVRLRNAPDMARYEKGIIEREALSEEDCMAEMMFLGLRLIRGCRSRRFMPDLAKALMKCMETFLKSI